MKVRLAYGAGGLEVELPDATTVVEPAYHAGADDEAAVLRAGAATSPWPARRCASSAQRGHEGRDLDVRRHPRAAARQDDPRRPRRAGRPDEDVVILVATGTHRGNTDEEIRAMLGDELVDRVRVVNHDARDKATLTFLGEHGDGVPVWINTRMGAGRPADHHRASSSRTSSPASAAGRSSSRPAWPAWRPCSCCTTRSGSATRRPPGACSRTTPSTRTSAPRRPRRRRTSAST